MVHEGLSGKLSTEESICSTRIPIVSCFWFRIGCGPFFCLSDPFRVGFFWQVWNPCVRINWKGSDNGRHAKPALVEVGPIEVGTIRSLSQSANSQSDKHNKASPTTTYSFHRFPLILLPLGLGAREGLQRPKKVLGLSLYQYFGSWWKLHKQIHPIAALAEAINLYKRKARGFFYLQWWSYSWWS